MSQRFTLDPPAFEQVLSAISLVQELKNQMPQAFAVDPAVDPEDAPLTDLAEIQQAIEMELLHLDGAMQRVVRAALQLNSASGAGVWLFTDREFVLRAFAGIVADNDAMRLEVLARLSASDLADRQTEPGLAASDGQVKSILVTPIHQGRNVAGALAILSSRPEGFSDRDSTRARLLSGVLAHALGKASESELKQSLSLERAAMLEVMDQLMPALRKLGANGERGRQELATFVADLGPEPGAEAVAAELAKIGEAIPEPGTSESEAGAPGNLTVAGTVLADAIGSEPNLFLLLQKEVEESREAQLSERDQDFAGPQPSGQVTGEKEIAAVEEISKANAVEPLKAVVDPVMCTTIREEMPPAGNPENLVQEPGPSLGKIAARAWEVVAAAIRAFVMLLSGMLRRAGSELVKAGRWIPGYLRIGLKSVAAAFIQAEQQLEDWGDAWVRGVDTVWTKTSRVLTRPVRVRVPARKTRKKGLSRRVAGTNALPESMSRKAAGPAIVLLIMAAFLVMMKTVGDSSHASVVSPPVTAANFDSDAQSNSSRAPTADRNLDVNTKATASPKGRESDRSASGSSSLERPSDRGAAKPSARVFTRSASSAAQMQESHLRITDQRAASMLQSMSHYEQAGLQRQALFGDDTAEFLLGMAYETGHGVSQNCAQAAEWVARSAAAGNPGAEFNLGLRYRDGDGVAADPELARQWLRKAAAHKYVPAPGSIE